MKAANYYEVEFSVRAKGYLVADKGSNEKLNPSFKLEIVPYPKTEDEDEGAQPRALEAPETIFDIDGDYQKLFENDKWITIK